MGCGEMWQGKLLVFWKKPFAVAAVVFIIDFGVLLILRSWQDSKLDISMDNKTFSLGDSVLLPLYVGLMSLTVKRLKIEGNYLFERWWWHLIVIILGMLLSGTIEFLTVSQGYWGMWNNHRLTKIYHRIIFVPVFYLIVSVFPLVLSLKRLRLSTACGLVSLSVYLGIALVEMKPMAQESVSYVANLAKVVTS